MITAVLYNIIWHFCYNLIRLFEWMPLIFFNKKILKKIYTREKKNVYSFSMTGHVLWNLLKMYLISSWSCIIIRVYDRKVEAKKYNRSACQVDGPHRGIIITDKNKTRDITSTWASSSVCIQTLPKHTSYTRYIFASDEKSH